jgi:hypothetical protein
MEKEIKKIEPAMFSEILGFFLPLNFLFIIYLLNFHSQGKEKA